MRAERQPPPPPRGEEYDEAVDAFGHLSVDQNLEVRSCALADSDGAGAEY